MRISSSSPVKVLCGRSSSLVSLRQKLHLHPPPPPPPPLSIQNPPLPTPEDEVGREGIAASWAGGKNGRSVIDKILPIADKLLSENDWLYLVTLRDNNPRELCIQMGEKGYSSRIVVQRSTEEESLQIIKFCRDKTLLQVDRETFMEPLVSKFSFWKSGNENN
ncbi:hypothetical protein ACFE04_017109 [Oxalis oulophora]